MKKNILIVDDDVDCTLYLDKALSYSGYTIFIAPTGKDAIDFLEKESPDVIILDIFLPDSDGVEIARRIRSKKGESFPLIGLSGTPIDLLKEQFAEDLNCFTAICIKPIDFETILLLLENANPPSREKSPMENLIKEYQASISERLELLKSLVEEFNKSPSEKNLKDFRLHIHKLAGSAGLYGFESVSEICKEFDQILGQDIGQFSQAKNLSEWVVRYNSYILKIIQAFSVRNESKKSELEQKLLNKSAIIGVIGLGNIGLSLLDAFGKAGFPLVGYDTNREKIKMLQNRESYLNYMDMEPLFKMMDQNRFKPSFNPEILKEADVLIISVPTSIDRYGTPNLTNLRSAFQTVSKYLRKHQLIVLQSSTYPGTTQEEFLPILQRSNLNVGIDFYLAHVPEIADIGNLDFQFTDMPRIVSGITPSCLKKVALLYQSVSSKVIPCSSTQVAESAKLLQNAFRLVNISLVNEMKMLFDTMNIDVWEVIAAASTKPFGFMPFYPGPGIGGDCIPIAPFYLVWKAKSTGGPTTMLEDAGRINDAMPHYVINKLIYGLNKDKKTLKDSKILILGVGYKKDVNDIRESIALKLIPILKNMQALVDYHDPYVKELLNFPEYPDLSMSSIEFNEKNLKDYDALVVLTDHNSYDFANIVKNSNLVVDTRNVSSKIADRRKIIKA